MICTPSGAKVSKSSNSPRINTTGGAMPAGRNTVQKATEGMASAKASAGRPVGVAEIISTTAVESNGKARRSSASSRRAKSCGGSGRPGGGARSLGERLMALL